MQPRANSGEIAIVRDRDVHRSDRPGLVHVDEAALVAKALELPGLKGRARRYPPEHRLVLPHCDVVRRGGTGVGLEVSELEPPYSHVVPWAGNTSCSA